MATRKASAKQLKFTEQNTRPCGDLMEVTLFVPQGDNAENFLLGAEARFGTMTIYAPDLEQNVEFGVCSAVLRLITAGCKIAYGERLGDQKPKEVRTRVQQQRVSKSASARSVKIGVAAASSASATSAAGSIEGKAQARYERSSGVEEKEVQTTDFEVSRAPIVPQSGGRWVFQTVSEPVLVARKSGDDHLCKIEVDADRITITAQFYFYPKHIVLLEGELKGGFPLYRKVNPSKAKAAVAKALIHRQLAEQSDAYNDLGGAVLGSMFRLQGIAEQRDD